jgi:hypothetical protein
MESADFNSTFGKTGAVPLVLRMTSLSQKIPLLVMSLNEDAGRSFHMVVVWWSGCESGRE